MRTWMMLILLTGCVPTVDIEASERLSWLAPREAFLQQAVTALKAFDPEVGEVRVTQGSPDRTEFAFRSLECDWLEKNRLLLSFGFEGQRVSMALLDMDTNIAVLASDSVGAHLQKALEAAFDAHFPRFIL